MVSENPLLSVRVGDKVILHRFFHMDEIVEAEAITARFIIIKGMKFSKNTGWHDQDDRLKITPSTPSVVERVRQEHAISHIKQLLNDRGGLPSADVLESIEQLLLN